MKINDYILKIKKLGACEEAVLAAHRYKTSQELWNECERGDWMLWLIGKLSGEPKTEKRKKLVITACKCARLALPYAGKNKNVAEKCIGTAENWANNIGNITIGDVRAAANAVYAANTVYAADTAYAAYAAANAAYAAANTVYAVYAAATIKTLKQCADIVRTDYPDIDSLFK
jgi:hypothetical protein